MRILLFGDIVGRPGRQAMIAQLSGLRERYRADFVSINAENAAGGVGLTKVIADDLFAAGADCLTLGNHAWDQPEMRKHIERDDRIVRASNYLEGAPGKGVKDFQVGEVRISVIQALGTIFMSDKVTNPFQSVNALLREGREIGANQITLIDMHAEATSEKAAMGHFLDGRVTCVTGTHTHCPTADTWVMPGGTAFQSDLGMCGDYHSIIGAQASGLMPFYLGEKPNMRFQVAKGEPTLCGLFLEIDDRNGTAIKAEPIRIGGRLSQTA